MDIFTKTYERLTDNHVFFWGGPLSNWFPTKIEFEEGEKKMMCKNSEQYFMYKKAKFFGDEETAQLILSKGSDPKTAKALGRRVRNYDDAKWAEARYNVMLDANMLKFTQNKQLKDHILSDQFKGKSFVEGSPIDSIWGICCDWKIAADDKSNWNGENLLGKVLNEVRDTFMCEQETPQNQLNIL